MPLTKTLTRIVLVVCLLSPSIPRFTQITRAQNESPNHQLAQTSFDCATVSELPQPECRALVAIYASTGGSQWIDQTGWLQTTMPCSWFGVTCHNNHVIKLDLNRNGLVGALPPEIEHLNMLIFLYLQNSQIDELPTEFGELSELRDLNLHNNMLTTLPPEIGHLFNLHTLDLGRNDLQTLPNEMSNLWHLQSLDLSYNQFEDVPTAITELSDLEKLNLGHNPLASAPSEIENLGELYILNDLLNTTPVNESIFNIMNDNSGLFF
ncbi:MAG: leucine-rich repeat domain-containing protein [Chloroflexota bacterium]